MCIRDSLVFVGARARPNTWLAVAFDLKVFFSVVAKEPADVKPADVFTFLKEQRSPRRGVKVVRLEDGEAGLSARTIRRRLSSVSGLFSYLLARGDAGVTVNPVPRGLAARNPGRRPGARGGVPLIRTPRTLPRVCSPAEVDGLVAALRTQRDRAMVEAMVLGGLRRCEVLGLRMEDLRVGERRVFIAEGKGGHQRLVPVSARFFVAVQAYLEAERPPGLSTNAVFVAVKGPARGKPLAVRGLDEILSGARRRAGLSRLDALRQKGFRPARGPPVASRERAPSPPQTPRWCSARVASQPQDKPAPRRRSVPKPGPAAGDRPYPRR